MPREDIIRTFDTPGHASAQLASRMAELAAMAIQTHGNCLILLSGGSTPIKAYEMFRSSDLEWPKISIALVDDRVVPITDAGSNFGTLSKIFTKPGQDGPALLTFKDYEAANFSRPADICIMGMGGDGHTASWFPGSAGLNEAMDIQTQDVIIDIDASNSPGAAPYSQRRTLTLPVIMGAKNIILFITGAEKWAVFESLPHTSVMDKPAKALLAAGTRLSTYWAPKA